MSVLVSKIQKLNAVKFQEGADATAINFQLASACQKVLFNLSGSITISAKTGTILKNMIAAADGTTIVPYLVMLFGSISFNGKRTDGQPGIQVQNIPLWLLWWEAYILNGGVGPVVNDGGMAAAGFAAGTYTISIDVPVYFFDPLTPKSQQNFAYFRPVCYDQNPNFIITGGRLFQTNYQANQDNVATTGDTSTAGALTYTLALTISASAVILPALKITGADACADICYEYQKTLQGGANSGNSNNITLASRGVQAYLHMFATNTVNGGAGGNTSLVEQGVDIFGLAANNIVETDAGTKQLLFGYASNIKAHDYDEFMKGPASWPEGALTIDQYGHSFASWESKTFLNPGAPAHIVNSNIQAAVGGSNIRFVNKTYNLSQTAIASKKLLPYQAA